MRGTRFPSICTLGFERIIPAGAGDTYRQTPQRDRASDHPRGCGGHWDCWHRCLRLPGSSPRVRGTPDPNKARQIMERIIPAGAGDTLARLAARKDRADHPRGCGGHAGASRRPEGSGGSSPRVRGTPLRRGAARMAGRIIPAGAGDTSRARNHPAPQPDHPRGCGGHIDWVTTGKAEIGSSPRVRGTRGPSGTTRSERRIIPAGAGDTGSKFGESYVETDHPRGCGGHSTAGRRSGRCAGSSPRVRGTPFRWLSARPGNRIIPAGAGDTSPLSAFHCPQTDHPRGCGGHGAGGSSNG